MYRNQRMEQAYSDGLQGIPDETNPFTRDDCLWECWEVGHAERVEELRRHPPPLAPAPDLPEPPDPIKQRIPQQDKPDEEEPVDKYEDKGDADIKKSKPPLDKSSTPPDNPSHKEK